MAQTDILKDPLIEATRNYFRFLDAGDLAIFDLFTEDVRVYFPRYGLGQGHAAMLEIMQGLAKSTASVKHDIDSYLYVRSGNNVAVEGTTSGTLTCGTKWAAGETPGGRFCNMFEFRGEKISRLAVYLDPDYLGRDAAGFLWGLEGRRW